MLDRIRKWMAPPPEPPRKPAFGIDSLPEEERRKIREEMNQPFSFEKARASPNYEKNKAYFEAYLTREDREDEAWRTGKRPCMSDKARLEKLRQRRAERDRKRDAAERERGGGEPSP